MKTRVFESKKKKKIMGGINGQLDTAEENIRKLEVTAIGIILNEAEREKTKTNKLNLTELWDSINRSKGPGITALAEREKREQKNVLSNKDNIHQMC